MSARKIKDGVYWVGTIHWDRRLFDELIPLPDGTTYNAYLIKGSNKTVLIDSVDPVMEREHVANLGSLHVDELHYIIANHAEQDHSGGIRRLVDTYPMAKVVTNGKCRNMLIDLLHIPEEKFVVVEDNDTLSLGDRTLEFITAPWVHWPETMLTYLREDKILFPCDLFGSHLATSDLYAFDEARVYESAKRYYAEIMMPFRTVIQKHLKRLEGYKIEIIAPSHGPLHNKPSFIIDAYRDWTSDIVKNEVILPYVSMHGSTEAMVNHLIAALIKRGVAVKPFNLTKTDIGELAISLVDAATIVIAAPTVLAGPHPAAVYATYLANLLRPKTKYASVIGSFGWGGKMLEQITGMIGNLRVELITPVIIKGHPKSADYLALDALADTIVEKHQALGISK
ncbi:MAG: FprA family A-type flavoprotein [candidate division WOR-3 bacterium]|nr:MAG: FprA family A-type flavoprotein [candidate division WOR-3 bacterium]